MTTQLDDYAERYTRAAFRREGGVLEITFHDGNGGSLVWDEPVHKELPGIWHDVGNDRENRVIIVTGAGDVFCATEDRETWEYPLTPDLWDRIFNETVQTHRNHLDIPVPMIAAINGPLRFHAEIALLCDIVIAADDTVLEDASHMPNSPPGDISGNIWPWLLGMNRGRYFVLTEEVLGVEEAHRLGVVQEVMPRAELLPRAWHLARYLETLDPLVTRYSRLMLTQKLKRLMLPDIEMGMALMGLCAFGWTMESEKQLELRAS